MTTGSLYLDSIKVGAIRGWIEERIPASLTGAQAALESGWGTSSLAKAPYNNQFGLKASSDWTGRVVNMPTKEYLNGAWVAVNADFRAYDDINDSVADHAKFFTSTEWRKTNYAAVIGETDYKKACYAVKAAGYATDPDYASKLINIIEKYKLYEWDKEAQSGTVPTASDDVEVVSNLQPKSKVVGGDLSDAGRAFGKTTGVSLIGDSLGVGTEPHLVKLIPNSNYDVKGSRQITHSDPALNGTTALTNMKNAGTLKNNVVVILGTNRGLTASEIDTFMSICGTERKVLWVETASAVKHNLSANEEMRKAATRHENAYVLGWYDMVGGLRKQYYAEDDIHMTFNGYFNFAHAIVQGVYEMCTGDFESAVAETTTMQFEGIKGFKLSEDGKLEYTDENKVKQVIQTEFKGLSTDGNTNFIYNVSANNEFNPQTGATEADWLEGRYESSDLKGLDLFMAACRDMMNRGEPEATYRVVLSELPEGMEIGAEGTIVDTASNPPRYITARISEITTSQANPEYNEVVITNVVEVKPFEKPTTLLIQEELRKNRDKLNTDYKERILESDLNSMGGLVLANEDSETTLIADVEVDGENVTEHYSDFRWERQSNNAESDKHYNEILSQTENGMTLNLTDKDIEGEDSNFICRIYDDAGNLVRTIMKKMVSQVKIKKEIDTVLDRFDSERTETEQAINEAVDSAKAEAERLDNERQLIIDGKFEEVNNANEALEQSIATAEQNAQDALTKAGASEDLAKTAKEISENALANIGTVQTELGEVKTQASDSLLKAQEALNATGTLSTQVQSYEETVDGYKSEVANYSRTNETLTAQVKSYEETVDGYTQSLTRVEGKFDNLQIGGRNLLTGTSKEEQEVKTASWEIGHWNPSLIIGEEYTFSFDIKSENATYLQSVFLNYSNSGYASNTPITKEWTRVSFTFKWNGGEYLGREIAAHIYPRPDYSGTYVSRIKLEKGNIATDWTPAPEDMVNDGTFKSYQNEVKSTTDEHTRRLTALDGDGGRVSKVEQTANQIQTSLSSYAQTTYVDTKITEKAGEITTNLSKVETLASNGLKGRNLLVTRGAISKSYLGGSETYPNPSPDNGGYGTDTSIVLIPVQAGEKYTLSKITGNTQYFRISFLDENKNYVNRITSSLDKQTITIPERSRFMWVSYPSNAKPMIELGSEKSEYQEAYDDRVSSVEFQTVKETTSLYERIIGKTENNISTNVSRIAMTSDLFQVAVGDIGNLVKNGNFRDGSTYGWDIDRNRLNNSDVRANGWYATTKVRDTYATYEVDVVPNETLNVEFRAWSPSSQPFTVGFRFYDQYGEHVVWAGMPSVNLTTTPTVYRGTFKVPDRAVKGIPWVSIQKLSDFETVFFNSVRISRSPSVDQVNSRFTQTREAINLGLYGDKDAISEVGIVKSGVRIKGNLITLDGQVNMTSSFIVPEGNIGNLSAKKITSGTIDTARLNSADIVTKGLTSNVIKSEHILADNALFTKLFTNDLATQKLATKQAWIKSSMIGDAQIGTAQIGQIDAGTGKIVNIDAQYITANHAKLVSAGFQGLNSNMHIDGGAIRINNNDGDFATMNAIPEFRSQDSLGTAAIMGKGRSQYYSNNQSRFYIGSSLNGDEFNGSVVHGVHISKGQTWGIYRQSDAFGGTPAQYFKTPTGWGAVNVVEELMRTGKVVNNFDQASALIRSLNGWGSSWPVLQPGDMVMYQAAVPGNSSGIERIWTMGTSSNGTTRTYSHVHHVFEGGTTGVSDARLKHDIKPTDIKALDHIANLSFKQFKWNRNDELEPLGLIAQESGILRVPDEEMEGIDIQRAMMLALKGIQELSQKVQEMGA